MSFARESELELKIELTRDQLQRMRWHPALGDLAAGEPVTRNLRSIYFDTPDHRLRALDISLRLRSDGERWLQTVKAGTAVCNGVSNPLEMEVAVERPEPDLELIDNRKVRRKVEKAIARSILEPVFETVVERTTRHLQSADGELELALDEGTVRAGGAENAICEAELELKSGAPECLLHMAAKLFGAEPVRLSESSKAERGYSLALGRTNGHAHADPQRGVLPRLEQDHTCAEAFALIVQSASRPDRRQPARRAGDGGSRRRAPAAHRLAPAAQRAQRFSSPARHARLARAGRPRAGVGAHRRRAARRRRADRAHLRAGGGNDQERPRAAAPARGAHRPPRRRARARAGGAQRPAMVGAAALSGAVAAHTSRAPRRSGDRCGNSPARRSRSAGRKSPTAASGSTISPSSSATRCARRSRRCATPPSSSPRSTPRRRRASSSRRHAACRRCSAT